MLLHQQSERIFHSDYNGVIYLIYTIISSDISLEIL